MHIHKNLLFYFLSALLFTAGMPRVFSQSNQQIDSLKSELVAFDMRKKQMGAHASPMMDTIKLSILHKLAMAYLYTNPNHMQPYAESELALSQKIHYKSGIGVAYNSLGMFYDFKSNYPVALDYYKKALAIQTETKNHIGEVDTYNNIGVLYSKLSDFPNALQHLLKGLSIARESNDSYGIFSCYNNIGVLYMGQKNYADALKNYFNCLSLQFKTKTQDFISVTYQNIGEIYLLQNQSEKALQYFTLGSKNAEKMGNLESNANNIEGIGKVYQKKNDYRDAVAYFIKSLDIRTQIHDPNGIASSNINIGSAYYKLGNHKLAITYVEKGLDYGKTIGQLDMMEQAYHDLSEIYNAMHDYKRAYANHLLYKEITDSIFNSERDKKFVQLQLRHEFKTVQDSIRILQDKKDLRAKEEIRQQRKTRNFIIITMSLIVILLVIILWQRNKIANIKKQEALKEERSRISRDLHDNLGAQLSTVRMFVSSLKNNVQNDAVTDIADNAVDLLDASINDLRSIMHEMNTSVLQEKGYLAATEALINKVNQLHLIAFTLTHHKMEQRPDSQIEHELFRITQELVNNTLKYAGAKNVSIDVLRRDGKLVLMYEDDGKGYDIGTVKKGNGLNNIETRIGAMGGTVEFDATPNAGSRTIIEIPV